MPSLVRRFIVCFAACVLIPGVALGSDRIVLGISALPPLVAGDGAPGFIDLLVKEAFRRIGIDARVENLPGERALLMSNEGLTDGEALRIAGLEKDYPNLLRVPEPVSVFDFMAWSIRKDARIADWSALKPLVVGYTVGWKLYDRQVKEAHEIIRVRNIDQLFPLLKRQRIDVALLDRWQGYYLSKRSGVEAHPVEPPLASVEMFIYLNAKHRAIVDPLAAALAAMKADGSVRRLHDATLIAYLPK